MTCPTTYTFINGLCYAPCISGYETNSEDATTCVEIGCSSYVTKSAANPSINTTCQFTSYGYTNEYCQKNVNNDAACECNNLSTDTGSGACQKFSKARSTLWPKCSFFEHYDGHECTFNASYFIFLALLLLFFSMIFYVFIKHASNPSSVSLPGILKPQQGKLFPAVQSV